MYSLDFTNELNSIKYNNNKSKNCDNSVKKVLKDKNYGCSILFDSYKVVKRFLIFYPAIRILLIWNGMLLSMDVFPLLEWMNFYP